jgi:hypothetical protein
MPEAPRPQKQSRRPTQKQRLLRVYAWLGAAAVVLLLAVLLVPGGPRDSDRGEAGVDPRVSERYPAEELGRPDEGTPQEGAPERDAGEAEPREGAPEERADDPGGVAVPERPSPEPGYRGSLAIVVDDVGNSLEDLEPFLEFEGPLTVAVLPQREFSEESARRAAAAGKEVIMHLPMQPVSAMDPGPGAIRVGMSAEDIARTVRANLRTVPGIRGVNNHMGSLATADPLVMDVVLRTLKEEGLFFLDSRTSVETVGRRTAEKHNLPYLERAVFLDNESNRDYIRNAVREGMQIAERKGHAVMIGHVMVNELVEVLNEMYPFIQDEGFDLRYLSELVLTPEFDDDPRS